MRLLLQLAVLMFLLLGNDGADAAPRVSAGDPVALMGEVAGRGDLSAVAQVHGFLAIGSDEAVGKGREKKNVIQLLAPDGAGRYSVHKTITLCTSFDDEGHCDFEKQRKEMDVEGIAVEGSSVFVIGSHSAARKAVRCDPLDPCARDCRKPRTYADNRAVFETRLRTEKRPKPGRDRLLRLEIDAEGNLSGAKEIDLGPYLDGSSVFGPFSRIASKENGVDIEGLAVRDGVLRIAFRGPVFRGGYSPVLALTFDKAPSDDDISYVNLGGRGVRSLARVSDGFLILAGPVGDGPAEFGLFHWDGRDMVPGNGARPEAIGQLQFLGDVPHPPCANPEGLAILAEQAGTYDVIVVYDGSQETVAQRLHVER